MNMFMRFRERVRQRKTPEYWFKRAHEQLEKRLIERNNGQTELEFARKESIVLLAKEESSCDPAFRSSRAIMIGYSRTRKFPMSFITKHIIGIGYPIALSISVIGFMIAETFRESIIKGIIFVASLAQLFVPFIIQSMLYEKKAIKEFEKWIKNKKEKIICSLDHLI